MARDYDGSNTTGFVSPASDSLEDPIDLSEILDLRRPHRYPVRVKGELSPSAASSGEYRGCPPWVARGSAARGQGQPVTSRKPFTSVFSGTVGGELYIVRPVGSTSTLAPG